MKFAIAAGILAHSIPVASERAQGAGLTVDDASAKDNLAGILASLKGKQELDSTRRRARKEPAGRPDMVLKNQHKLSEVKECNPTSQDPDVGILSCGQGKLCQFNEYSSLGGHCVSRNPLKGLHTGLARAFSRDGRLKNAQTLEHAVKSTDILVECDPQSVDANTGILSCAQGMECVENAASLLGGACAPVSTSHRVLNLGSTGDFGLCDTESPYYNEFDCDCRGFDNETGTGAVPCTLFRDYCLGIAYNGCEDACLSRTVEYNLVNFTKPGYKFCMEFSSPSNQIVCFEETYDSYDCSVTIDGNECATCQLVPNGNYTDVNFDCSNAGGIAGNTGNGLAPLLPIVNECYEPLEALQSCEICPSDFSRLDTDSFGEYVDVSGFGTFNCYSLYVSAYKILTISEDNCPVISDEVADTCCASFCDLCGPGYYISPSSNELPLNGNTQPYSDLTCGSLAYVAYNDFSIPGVNCPTASAVAVSQGCCEPYAIYECDVCGTGNQLAYPNALFTYEGQEIPCSIFERSLNETACELVSPFLASTCCAATPAPTLAPVTGPTSSPANPTGVESSATAGRFTLFAMTAILGAGGLAVSALLN